MLARLSQSVWRFLLLVGSGGMVLQLESCSTGVRDAVIVGLEQTSLSLANILISALFDGLGDGTTL